MKKIEFIDGEPFCRYDGILMTPENCIKMFGTDYTEVDSEEFIQWEDGTIYTDFSFSEIIKAIAYKETFNEPEYDDALSQGYGFGQYTRDKEIENCYILTKGSVNSIKDIKPIKSFKKDHPEVKLKKLIKFSNELYKYFEEL